MEAWITLRENVPSFFKGLRLGRGEIHFFFVVVVLWSNIVLMSIT